MKKKYCIKMFFFLMLFSRCTQVTMIYSKEDLNTFKFQNKNSLIKIDTVNKSEDIYKVYYKSFP